MNSFTPKPAAQTPKEEERPVYPWDRQEGETHSSYEAFTVYRGIPVGRTIEMAAMAMYGDHWMNQIDKVRQWAKQNKWERRAAEYELFIREHEYEYVEHKKRHSRIKMADKLGDLTDTLIDGAMGVKKVSREQSNLLLSVMDRVGPEKQQPQKQDVNIFNRVEIGAPELPSEATKELLASEIDEGQMTHDAESFLPDFKKKPR